MLFWWRPLTGKQLTCCCSHKSTWYQQAPWCCLLHVFHVFLCRLPFFGTFRGWYRFHCKFQLDSFVCRQTSHLVPQWAVEMLLTLHGLSQQQNFYTLKNISNRFRTLQLHSSCSSSRLSEMRARSGESELTLYNVNIIL